jgi:GNAT acetyltransferase-like protein
MTFSVRPVDLDADRDLLIELMLRYLTTMSDGPRYDWLYRQNPDGLAQLWILTDTDKGTIAGSGGIIPRRMYVQGEEKLGAILVDFWIHPEYRSLGPALQLQRACLAGIAAGPYNLYYDFPERSMVAVYRRLGVESSQSVVRMTKLLNVKRKLGKVDGVPVVGPVLTAGANAILRLLDLGRRSRSGCVVCEHQGTCGEEFTDLARRVSTKYGICVARTAGYMNWRYWSHFRNRYKMLTARRDGKLQGYIIYLDGGEGGTIIDLFGADDQKMKAELVFMALEALRERGVLSINAPSLDNQNPTALLRKLGFFPRESHAVMISATPGASGQSVSLQGQKVFLMEGDRDS